jgi:hypothetical protein
VPTPWVDTTRSARGQEQLGADLGVVRPSTASPAADPSCALANRPTGGRELARGTFGGSGHADRVEHAVADPQLGTGGSAADLAALALVGAAQSLPVERVGPGQFGTQPGSAKLADRFGVQAFGRPGSLA